MSGSGCRRIWRWIGTGTFSCKREERMMTQDGQANCFVRGPTPFRTGTPSLQGYRHCGVTLATNSLFPRLCVITWWREPLFS